MLLHYVVQQLDEELARLHALREIIISLERTPASLRQLTIPPAEPRKGVSLAPETATPEAPSAHEEPAALKGASKGAPKRVAPARTASRGRRERAVRATRPPAPSALSNAVSEAPVLVSPSALAAERALRAAKAASSANAPTEPQDAEHVSDALIRNLSQRWLSNDAEPAQ